MTDEYFSTPEEDRAPEMIHVATRLNVAARVAEVEAFAAQRRHGPRGEASIVSETANPAPSIDTHPVLRAAAARRDPVEAPEPQSVLVEADASRPSAVTGQSAALLALAQDNCDVFCDEGGEPLAALDIKSRRQIVRLHSREFRAWLHHLFYAHYMTIPSVAALRDATAVLEGNARFGSETRRVHVRVARLGDSIYVDLANDDGEAVRVSRTGWEVVRSPEVQFRRSKGMAALPRPVRDGHVDELRQFVNVPSDDAFRLLVAWQVHALRPEGPYPILVFQGEHGSAKSSATRLSRTTVDPSRVPLRSMPRSERDLAVAVSGAWVLAVDNQSGLAASMSDALCRVSTGGGVGSRQLFTDGDEFVLAFMRPVVINGIDDLATRPDLAERALIFNLPPIAPSRRIDEATLIARFNEAHPRILGALLDGVVSALANLDAVQIEAAPRMADFARWATAAEPGLGWRQGAFLEAYSRHRHETDQEALERDVIGTLITRLPGLDTTSCWTGTATQLLRDLHALADDDARRDAAWPRRPNALSARLRRIAPLLRTSGYVVSTRRAADERTLVIERAAPSSSSSSSSAPLFHAEGDDDHDDRDDGSPTRIGKPFAQTGESTKAR